MMGYNQLFSGGLAPVLLLEGVVQELVVDLQVVVVFACLREALLS